MISRFKLLAHWDTEGKLSTTCRDYISHQNQKTNINKSPGMFHVEDQSNWSWFSVKLYKHTWSLASFSSFLPRRFHLVVTDVYFHTPGRHISPSIPELQGLVWMPVFLNEEPRDWFAIIMSLNNRGCCIFSILSGLRKRAVGLWTNPNPYLTPQGSSHPPVPAPKDSRIKLSKAHDSRSECIWCKLTRLQKPLWWSFLLGVL